MASGHNEVPEFERPEYRHPGCNFTNADHERAARALSKLRPDLFAANVIGFDIETEQGSQAATRHIREVESVVAEVLPCCTQGDRTLTSLAFARAASAARS